MKTARRRAKKKHVDPYSAQTATLADEIAGATKMRFGADDRAIDEELRSTKAQRGTIDQAFNTYKGRLDEIASAQRAGWQAAMAQNAALAGQVKSTLGVAPTGNAELDARVAAQQQGGNATEAAAINTQGQLLGSLGIAEGNDLSRRAAATDVRRDERQSEVDARLREIGRKRTDLADQKGAFMVDLLRQIQQDDAKNAIAAEGLQVDRDKASMQHSEFLQKLDVDKLLARIRARDISHDNGAQDQQISETTRHNKVGEKQAGTKLSIDQQNADTRATDVATKNGSGKKGTAAGMTRSERKKVFGDVRSLKSLGKEFGELVVANGGNTGRATDALKKRHRGTVSEGDINVARDLAVLGKVSPANQTYLKTKYNGYLPRDFGGGKKKAKKKKGK